MTTSVRGLARRRALVLLACQLLPVAVFLLSGSLAPHPPPEAEAAGSAYIPITLIGSFLSIAVIFALYNAVYELLRRWLGCPRWLYLLVGLGVFLTVQSETGGLADSYAAWQGTVRPVLIAALLDLVIYTAVNWGAARTP